MNLSQYSSGKSKISIIILLTIILSIAIRLMPSVITSAPFSNDSWPLIHATCALTNNPEKRVFELDGIYGHHARWPTTIIFVSVLSKVTGLSVINLYELHLSFTAGLSIGILSYCIGLQLFRDKNRAFVFSSGFTLFTSFSIYTSSFLKETYAHIIVLAIIFYMLKSIRSITYYLTLATLSMSLILAHPLPVIMIFASTLVSQLNNKMDRILRRSQQLSSGLSLLVISYSTIMILASLLYNMLISRQALIPFTLIDVAVIVFYTVGVYILYYSLTWTHVRLLIYLVVAGTIVVSILSQSTIPRDWSIAILTTPMLIAFIIHRIGRNTSPENPFIPARSLLLIISSFSLYLSTWLTIALSIIHRILNYLVYPFSYYLASPRNTIKSYMGVLISLILTFSTIIAIALSPLPLFYYWRYTQRDLETSILLENYSHPGIVIYGDVKYSYMIMNIVREAPIDVISNPCRRVKEGHLLLVSIDNLKYGYPITPLDYVGVRDDLVRCLSLVFNNNYVFIYG